MQFPDKFSNSTESKVIAKFVIVIHCLFYFHKNVLTRHKVQQSSSDGIQAGAVRDVRAGVTEDGHYPVRDCPSLAGQVVSETVCRLHERWQHDRLVGKLDCAEHLKQIQNSIDIFVTIY